MYKRLGATAVWSNVFFCFQALPETKNVTDFVICFLIIIREGFLLFLIGFCAAQWQEPIHSKEDVAPSRLFGSHL